MITCDRDEGLAADLPRAESRAATIAGDGRVIRKRLSAFIYIEMEERRVERSEAEQTNLFLKHYSIYL